MGVVITRLLCRAKAAYETIRDNGNISTSVAKMFCIFLDSQTTLSRPLLQPQVVEFSRATAKPYLQQTESLWMKLDLTRQTGMASNNNNRLVIIYYILFSLFCIQLLKSLLTEERE